MSRRTGFTLLELVISCAILVSIFAFVTTSLTRVHRLRADAETRTRALAEGRALLDRIADDFAYAIPESFSYEDDGAVDADLRDTSSRYLEFVRYVPQPRFATHDESDDKLPYVRQTICLPADGGNIYETQTASPRDSVTYSNAEEIVEYSIVTNGHFAVTNATAGEIMGTHTFAAAKGDVVTIPVTSYHSYERDVDATEEHDSFEIVASETPGTNAIIGSIVFTNSFSTRNTFAIQRHKAMSWPAPGSYAASLEQFVGAESALTSATNGPIPSAALRYPIDTTDVIAPTNDFPTASTNAYPTVSVTNGYESATVTNSYPAVTVPNDLPEVTVPGDYVTITTTNAYAYATLSSATIIRDSAPDADATSAMLTNGFVSLTCSDSPYRVADYWTIRKGSDESRYQLPSLPSAWADKITPDTGYLTNRVVMDGYTYQTTLADYLQFSFTSNITEQISSFEPPQSSPTAITNYFHAYDNANGSNASNNIPFSLYQIIEIGATDAFGTTDSAFSSHVSVTGCASNLCPIVSQSITRSLTIDTAMEVTTNEISVSISRSYLIESRFQITNSVPSSVIATNSYLYAKTHDKPASTAIGGRETRYEAIVLGEDFDGSDDATTGIWLVKSHDAPRSELTRRTVTRERMHVQGGEGLLSLSEGDDIGNRSVCAISIVPLCFSTNSNERLFLEVWSPRTHPDTPPVCADVTLEIMDPKYVSLMRDPTTAEDMEIGNRAYQKHAIRLSRRVPIGTAGGKLP